MFKELAGSGANVDVKQYSVDTTERSCSDPIDVTVVGSTATIGIGSTSNAYGRKYVQTAEPTTDVCDGDIWYDLTGTTGDISLGVGINSGGTVIGTGITTLNFVPLELPLRF